MGTTMSFSTTEGGDNCELVRDNEYDSTDIVAASISKYQSTNKHTDHIFISFRNHIALNSLFLHTLCRTQIHFVLGNKAKKINVVFRVTRPCLIFLDT